MLAGALLLRPKEKTETETLLLTLEIEIAKIQTETEARILKKNHVIARFATIPCLATIGIRTLGARKTT